MTEEVWGRTVAPARTAPRMNPNYEADEAAGAEERINRFARRVGQLPVPPRPAVLMPVDLEASMNAASSARERLLAYQLRN